MKRLKHIKRIFENANNVKLISITDRTVVLINPEGKTVSVDMEEDGEFSEEVDEYTQDVSVSGDDGTYKYSMVANTDKHDNHFEIMDHDIEVETLEEVQIKKEARAEKSRQQYADMSVRKVEQDRVHKQAVKDSGLSETEYRREGRLKELNNMASYKDLNKDVDPDAGYLLISFEHYYYDEDGKIDDVGYSLIKYPYDGDPFDKDDEMYSELGDFFGTLDEDKIKQDLYDKKIIVKRNSKYRGIKQPNDVSDPNNYIKRAPFYTDVDSFIDE